jgi:hypothetical protein
MVRVRDSPVDRVVRSTSAVTGDWAEAGITARKNMADVAASTRIKRVYLFSGVSFIVFIKFTCQLSQRQKEAGFLPG